MFVCLVLMLNHLPTKEYLQAKKCFVFINPNGSLFQILFCVCLDLADYLSVLLAVDKETMLYSTGAGKKNVTASVRQ